MVGASKLQGAGAENSSIPSLLLPVVHTVLRALWRYVGAMLRKTPSAQVSAAPLASGHRLFNSSRASSPPEPLFPRETRRRGERHGMNGKAMQGLFMWCGRASEHLERLGLPGQNPGARKQSSGPGLKIQGLGLWPLWLKAWASSLSSSEVS